MGIKVLPVLLWTALATRDLPTITSQMQATLIYNSIMSQPDDTTFLLEPTNGTEKFVASLAKRLLEA